MPPDNDRMEPCLFCGRADTEPSVEHVIPKWARRTFAIKGRVTAGLRDVPGAPIQHVASLPDLNITLRGAICEPCNTVWLSRIEKRASAILKPMIVLSAPSVVLDAASQAKIALWAVKTGLLLELAIRQMYPETRSAPGYVATTPELAWLRHHGEPPPRSRVFLGCWDAERAVPLNYGPASADVIARDGTRIPGHLLTFTLGFVAFQVFTTDFVAADVHDAPAWHSWPREPYLRAALPRIWPPPGEVLDITWPTPAFRRDEWARLVAWDGELHPLPDEPVQPPP